MLERDKQGSRYNPANRFDQRSAAAELRELWGTKRVRRAVSEHLQSFCEALRLALR